MKKFLSTFFIIANICCSNASAMQIDMRVAVKQDPIMQTLIGEDLRRILVNGIHPMNLQDYCPVLHHLILNDNKTQAVNDQIAEIADALNYQMLLRGGYRRFDELLLRYVAGQLLNENEQRELQLFVPLYFAIMSAEESRIYDCRTVQPDYRFDFVPMVMELLPQYGIPVEDEDIVQAAIVQNTMGEVFVKRIERLKNQHLLDDALPALTWTVED